ncbi:branched-chain amino acid ABC transporter permease [Falsiroseomonas stagni]|uniref:Branched-chain amino acid transport system permease protein n=1 Tax=Falsiroseomonas stagni DSM 19981 TaxID=1123062 RepID=A0A1I4EBY5_9PROT|nr:branched-chain amino acid ABC transporter permease [Falsiroseomonas stagni]SFL01896.1 branched-chain amino acid transport system permease protein [Falsiroseomonas stagni DSM 19981]
MNARWATLLILAAVIAVIPWFFPSGYYFRVAALVWVTALGAVGLQVLMGQAGQVSLGHAGFVGIGAYAMALGPKYLGLPVLACLPLGAVLAGLIAFLVGRPILRLKGHYLAVATLGFGILVALVLVSEIAITGGPDGIRIPRPEIFGWRPRGGEAWYWINGAALLIGVWLALNIQHSPSGRALAALHDSEVAARTIGIDVARHKLRAFVIAAVYGAVAGGLMAMMNGFVTPDAAGFLQSVEYVTMVVIGGLASVPGAVVGAAALVLLPQALTVFHEYEHAVLGLLIMLFMIFLRVGIVPGLATLLRRRPA